MEAAADCSNENVGADVSTPTRAGWMCRDADLAYGLGHSSGQFRPIECPRRRGPFRAGLLKGLGLERLACVSIEVQIISLAGVSGRAV